MNNKRNLFFRIKVLALAAILSAFIGCDLNSDSESDPSADITAIPTSNLVGSWLFSGNANDSSSNGYNASLIATPTLTADRHGTASSAYALNGTSQYIKVDNVAGTDALDLVSTSFTISVWAKAAAANQNGGLVSKYQTGFANGYAMNISNPDGAGTLYLGADKSSHSSAGINNSTAWIHYVWVYDISTPTAVQLYINNVLATTTALGGNLGVASNTDMLTFGNDFGNRFWAGAIDDVRIYSKALTVAEIGALYNE